MTESHRTNNPASDDLERLVEEQRIIAEIGRIVGSTLDVHDVYSRVAEKARALVSADRIVISVFSDDKTELIEQHIDGVPIEGSYPGARLPAKKDDLYRQVFVEQRPFLVTGMKVDEYKPDSQIEDARRGIGLRSMLLVPLIWQGQAYGILSFRAFDSDVFNSHAVELAQQISNQIAGAIATSNQYALLKKESDSRQRLADEQARIADIGRIVSSTLDIDEVFSSFVDQARQLIPFDRLVISVNEADGLSSIDAYIDGEIFEGGDSGKKYSNDDGYKRVAAEQSQINVSFDGLIEMSKTSPNEQARLDAGFRSLLMVPMVSQGNIVGTLIFRSKQPTKYSDHHADIAKQIGAQIGGAVAASHQFRLLEAESTERNRLALEQARIAEIGRIVSSTLDITEVLAAFVEQARLLVPFDRIAITVANDDLTGVTDVLVDGMELEKYLIGVSHPFTDNKIQADVIANRKRYVSIGEDYRKYATEMANEQTKYHAGLRSMMLIPLIWQGKSIGSLNLRSTDPQAFGNHEIELAEQIGAQIAGAISTSNQYRLLTDAVTDVQLQATALEAADDAIIIRNADATVLYVNSGFERQTGFSRDEIIGTDFKHPEQLDMEPLVVESVWEHLRQGKTWRKTISSTHKDGTEYIVDATMNPIFNDSGEIDKFLGVRRDVTEQVKADDAIRTQAAALEAAGDAVMILNSDTSTEWVNDAFVRDTGYSKQEAIGRRSSFLRSDKDDPEIFAAIWQQVRSGQTWRGRIWTQRKDGSEYLADSSLTPVFGDDGSIVKFVGTRRNITDLVQAEEDRDARRYLDVHNQQLLDLSEQREEFFSSVSHELRTPLTSIMAFADILSRDRDGRLSSRQQEHLDVIKRNSRNLSNLVEDMLDFSLLGTDQLKLDESEFEIHSLLDSVIESLEPTARQRGQTLSIEPHTAPVWIRADHGRIVQVISNLITNSCKYSPSSSRITIEVEVQRCDLSIAVIDSGYGISTADLKNIYSPFFRSNQPEVREETGSGLGLAIVKTLIDLHGGTIEARSLLDEGTKIIVTLPGATSTPMKDRKA